MTTHVVRITCTDGFVGVILIPQGQMSGRTLALAMDRAVELERGHGGADFPQEVAITRQPLERIA